MSRASLCVFLLAALTCCACPVWAQKPEQPVAADSVGGEADTLAADTAATWIEPEPVVEVAEGPLERDLITSSGVVRVLTPVNGDLFVAGGEVSVGTSVLGDVWAAGGIVDVSGSANGDLRAAGYRVTLSGFVGSGAACFCSSFLQDSSSQVWGDLSLHCEKARVEGTVHGQLRGSMRVLTLDGAVKGGVVVSTEKLVVGSGARVEGDLVYRSANEATVSPSALILGGVIREEPKEGRAAEPGVGGILKFTNGMRFVWFIGMVIAGLVLSVFVPGILTRADEALRSSPFVSLLAGFVLLVCVPIGLLVLLVAVVGWPLMFLLALLYVAVIIFSGIFAGLSVGRAILVRSQRAQKSIFWPMALGLLVLVVASSIPLVGFVIRWFIIMFGLGAVWISQWRHFRQRRAA